MFNFEMFVGAFWMHCGEFWLWLLESVFPLLSPSNIDAMYVRRKGDFVPLVGGVSLHKSAVQDQTALT